MSLALLNAVFQLDHCVHEVLALVIVSAQHTKWCIIVQTNVGEPFSVEQAELIVSALEVGVRVQLNHFVKGVYLDLRVIFVASRAK